MRFQGVMQRASEAQMKPPRLMLIYLGSSAVISVPADKELALMLVPS